MGHEKEQNSRKPSMRYEGRRHFTDTEERYNYPSVEVKPERIVVQPKPLLEAWAKYCAQDHAPKCEFDPTKTGRCDSRESTYQRRNPIKPDKDEFVRFAKDMGTAFVKLVKAA